MQNPRGDFHSETQDPNSMATKEMESLTLPLHNLSELSTRMDSLQRFVSQSINTNTLLPKQQMDTLSNEIASAVRHVIVNAAALVTSVTVPPTNATTLYSNHLDDTEHCDVVEFDAAELLANHFHFCEVCGKGFTRDANLRMHMRSHGDQFKTPEALRGDTRFAATRFSCPFEGCKRNRLHKKFRSLKSMFCLKNHFKRSHCPKTYTCDRCRKKSFAVLSDFKSHAKQCRGESTWKCSCGTTFSRKEKLVGHVALFEGHYPALEVGEEQKGKPPPPPPAEGEGVGALLMKESDCLDGLPEGFFDDLEDFGFQF